MVSVNIELSRLYERLFSEDIRVVEHAPVDCRWKEAAHAFALMEASAGRVTAIIGGDASFIDYVTDRGIKKTKFGDHTRFLVTPGELWVIDPKSLGDLAPRFESVVVLRTDQYSVDPTRTLRTTGETVRRLYVGTKPDSADHWTEVVEGTRLKVDALSAIAYWPELEGQGLPATDPFYARKMLLSDELPRFDAMAFTVFARKRIRIRTDKPTSVLAEDQRRAAEKQYGTPIVPFERSLLQRRYIARKRLAVAQGKKPWFLLLKYRRGGFTTTEQAMSYQVAVSRPNSQVVTLADTAPKAQRIFRMVGIMAENDPDAPLQVGDSRTQLEWANGSLFFIGTAGSKSFARGDTIQRAHGSECAFWCPGPHQLELVSDIKAGLIGAASYGEIVFETTPNRRNWFYQDYIDAKNGESEFTPIFVRWFDDPMNRAIPGTYDPEEVLETLTDKEKDLVDLHELDLAQIAFRRSQIKTYKHLFPQEFPEDDETCFLTSGQCFFDIQIVLNMIDSLGNEEHGHVKHLPGGHLTIWRKPVPGRRYVAGCDTSEGLQGCDKNGVGVLDFETGEQVASLHGRFKPEKLAKYGAELCERYNRALLGVERNNHGHAVILALKNLDYYEPHYLGGPLYWHSDTNVRKDLEQDGIRSDTARAGWNTTPATRPVMLDGLQTAVESGAMTVHDREFLGECTTFTLQTNGKFAADQGCYDDSVIKWAIAWQMREVRQPQPEIIDL